MSSHLTTETGTILKKWKDRLPVALLYPNTYPIAVSNLGFQLVYSLLNSYDTVVCERFVYPDAGGPLRSLESNRPLCDFPMVFGSISFESDYPNLIALLAAGGIEPMAQSRTPEIAPGNPLVILGGVGVFMNPEPLALFSDMMIIGEAEPVLPGLIDLLRQGLFQGQNRHPLLRGCAMTLPGCYVPAAYTFSYRPDGSVERITVEEGMPERVRKVVQTDVGLAGHSRLLSPDAELGMFMTELGRGCSRGCRFCAAGYIYRPPRLWSAEAIIESIRRRPDTMDRIGLLGTEMASETVLHEIAAHLEQEGCSLSFSSLRADRISDQLLSLLGKSGLKSAAIAPDGCSERLRLVINKGLGEQDLIRAAVNLVSAGIFNLKIYVMIGLPTETSRDLDEMIDLIKKIRAEILPVGQNRGRVSTITLSVNSFVPKPWTPFQFVPFGGVMPDDSKPSKAADVGVSALKKKIRHLRSGLNREPNVRINTDRPELVLQQAVFSRGDRRLAPVLLNMAVNGLSFKQAMKIHGLSAEEYVLRPRHRDETFCWEIIDHGISREYLRQEYRKGLAGKATVPCDTSRCRRCGVCNETTTA